MTTYPAFPSGFWRSVILHPEDGYIVGALEDDVHNFIMRMDHADGRITDITARAVRHPWTACAAAPAHLAQDLIRDTLVDIANRDPRQHCTHLFDLAIVMAAHADDTQPSRYDMRVGDRVEGRTTATLDLNGEERLRWHLTASHIDGDGTFANRDLKRLSTWKSEYPDELAEQATLLRRAIFVSGVRRQKLTLGARGTSIPEKRHGVCFNYQPEQIEETFSIYDIRDFSGGDPKPLASFNPHIAFDVTA